jgi:hypothetical protein
MNDYVARVLKFFTVLSGFFIVGCGHMHAGVSKLEFKNMPSVGRSPAGQDVLLGGFSGLHYLGKTETGAFRFVTHTDRGPNGDMYNGNRPFLIPDFNPRWIFFTVDSGFKEITIEKTVLLRTKDGPISGLPFQKGPEDPVDVYDYLLGLDPNGIDPEGITRDTKGHFWMGEEYAPSLVEFNDQGILLKRYFPGKDFSAIFARRRLNRGFEGITFYKNQIWAFLESPLSETPGDLNIPVLVFDPFKGKGLTEKYYPIDSPLAQQIGDAANFDDRGMLVIERNNIKGPGEIKKLYFATEDGTKPLLKKKLVADLVALGIDEVEKLEGLTVIDGRYLALVNDNDFGLRGRPDYLKTGLVPTKAENSFLYIIDLNSLLPKNWHWEEEPKAE